MFGAGYPILRKEWCQTNDVEENLNLTIFDVIRLQNSRFRTFSEGAKRCKHDPRVWSARASHARLSPFSLAVLHSLQTAFRSPFLHSLHTAFRSPFLHSLHTALRSHIDGRPRSQKTYDCFAVHDVIDPTVIFCELEHAWNGYVNYLWMASRITSLFVSTTI